MRYHQIPDKPLGNSRERKIRRHNERIVAGQDITRVVRATECSQIAPSESCASVDAETMAGYDQRASAQESTEDDRNVERTNEKGVLPS